jgi:hypothetical protein
MTGVENLVTRRPRRRSHSTRTKPRVAIIGPAELALSPRGQRLHVIAAALSEHADIEIISVGRDRTLESAPPRFARLLVRRLAAELLLDREELAAARAVTRWQPHADAALLIGYPFSTVSWAARRLARAGIPYVVDIGDPWVLFADTPRAPSPATLRARRNERFFFEHAAGAVLPTTPLASAVSSLFGGLPVLARPNGFERVVVPPPAESGARDPQELRLVHYGGLYSARADCVPLLDALASSNTWRRIRFTNFGFVGDGSLAALDPRIEVSIRSPRPWSEVAAAAREHDVALVVGGRDPRGLPSKAVQYLTLPIPRAALVRGGGQDQLEQFVSDKPGWVAIHTPDDLPIAADLLRAHLARAWTAAELEPPADEAWPVVAARILEFFSACTCIPPVA